MHRKKGVLQPLLYTAGVVTCNWWEMWGTCNVTPQWCLHVPAYTCLALFTSSEKHFLQECTTPSPYISPLPPLSSHELPISPLDSDDSLRELGFWVCKGVLSREEASQWYTIMTASFEQASTQRNAIWDLVSSVYSRESCWANPKVPRRLGSRSGKLATLLGCKACKRAVSSPWLSGPRCALCTLLHGQPWWSGRWRTRPVPGQTQGSKLSTPI